MPRTIQRPSIETRRSRQVIPSIVDPWTTKPFTLDQELEPFGAWVGDPVWVPPKDPKEAFAETMLSDTRPFTSNEKRWATVFRKHRDDFTQVREFDLFRSSIRLPKGKFFVTVTEQADFDKITDPIPDCVQTRLDEFLAGPGKKRGVRVYYLKPLCVEAGDKLILTTREDLKAAIAKVQAEVFSEYRRRALHRRPIQALASLGDLGMAVPRWIVKQAFRRDQQGIDELHAHLEFKRRKLALKAARAYRKCRTESCTFDEMLELTNTVQRTDVVDQYCAEKEISRHRRKQLMQLAAGALPWFVVLSLTASVASASALTVLTAAPPVIVCDPAFVAEMPGSRGKVLKIGHFDEVDGVMHVEI